MDTTNLRQTIDAAVTDLGYNADRCNEGMFIQKGIYSGRQFRYEGVRTIWFAEEEVVKLYGEGGTLLGTLTVAEVPTEMRQAS